MALTDLNSTENVGIKKRKKFVPSDRSTLTSEQIIEFDKWHGFYREIPELQAVIDRLALWVVYGGDDSDDKNSDISFNSKSDEEKFKRISGNGFDTPEDVFYNLFRVGKICGCSIAEKIRDRANKKGLINLKPLDPQTIKIKQNKKGFIEEFEQISLKSGHDGMQDEPQNLKKEQIFFIAWNRIADEIVGISTVEKLQSIIDYRHQAMEDLAEVFHRYVVPFWLFYADTDDETEISNFNTKVKKMIEERDFMTIPKDAISSHERLAVPQYSTLDPLNWIKHLERYFLISEGVPELISGIGRETADASSRMIYLAWRIIAIANQKIFEKHIEKQLGIKMKFPRPVNILAPEITETRTLVQPKKNEKIKQDPQN
jgi:hypothetical protein